MTPSRHCKTPCPTTRSKHAPCKTIWTQSGPGSTPGPSNLRREKTSAEVFLWAESGPTRRGQRVAPVATASQSAQAGTQAGSLQLPPLLLGVTAQSQGQHLQASRPLLQDQTLKSPNAKSLREHPAFNAHGASNTAVHGQVSKTGTARAFPGVEGLVLSPAWGSTQTVLQRRDGPPHQRKTCVANKRTCRRKKPAQNWTGFADQGWQLACAAISLPLGIRAFAKT